MNCALARMQSKSYLTSGAVVASYEHINNASIFFERRVRQTCDILLIILRYLFPGHILLINFCDQIISYVREKVPCLAKLKIQNKDINNNN